MDEKSTDISTTGILSLRQSVVVCVEGPPPTIIGRMSGIMLSADLFYLFGHTEKVLMCSECSEFNELLRGGGGVNDPSCYLKHVTTSKCCDKHSDQS